MIDTGAAPNIIKRRNLRPEIPIKTDQILLLSGITEGNIKTLGYSNVHIMGYPVTLQIVADNFPITQEGILGSDFLRDATKIDFVKRSISWQNTVIPFSRRDTVTIPSRSRITIPIRIENPTLAEGYVPRINLGDNVYLGDAIVTNRGGKAFIGIINASEKDREIEIPVVQLEEIEFISRRNPDIVAKNAPNVSPLELETSCNGTHIKPSQVAPVSLENELRSPREIQISKLLRLDHLNRDEANHVEKLINKYSDVFQITGDKLGYTNAVQHKIVTTDDQPIHTKQYRYPPTHREEINKQVKTLLDNDIVSPSNSPYNSPLWVVPKKPDSLGNKRWRMVIDFRALNEKTIGDAYPLPNITEILDQLGSAKYFSVFDLASGFHQIPMHESDAQKTAFTTPYGHYHFKRMPFGLKNAPATFQRLMDQVLSGLQGIELFVYLDDIVLYASSLSEHELKFNKLADRLRKANLKLQPDKCEFLRKEVTYLGHIISTNGVRPDPQKITAVENFPRPKNPKAIKQFLGLAGYYRRFLPGFSKTARPLTELLKKDAEFRWSDSQEQAFVTLKISLCKEPLLQYPDFTLPFVVTTDASKYAIGGILSQGEIGKDRPIAYTSRLLNSAEQNYSTIEKELLAIVYSVNYFRPYLYGHKFTLVTDHKPLVWLDSVKDPTSRLARWRLKLAEYEYKIRYKAGKMNLNADALSRNPAVASTDKNAITKTNNHKPLFPLARNENPTQHNRPSDLIPAPTTHTKNNLPEQSHDIPEDEFSPANDDTLSESDTDSDESSGDSDPPLRHTPNAPHQRFNVREVRDSFITRKDSLIIFSTQTGEPCDLGARILAEQGRLPRIENAVPGRAKVINDKNRYIIVLIIKERISELITRQTIIEAISALLSVIDEIGLTSVSICKSDIDRVSWTETRGIIDETFNNHGVKIAICTNEISIPPISDRLRILREYHDSAAGGHKGITKTYWRIKYRYYWPNMKADIQAYVQGCRDCQKKKLVRVKTRQPMILTDTPAVAFEKISMDIMGPLPETRSGNVYILTIQDLLSKYSLAIPLRQITAIDVANAFVNEIICVYGAPKALLTDQGTNFLSALMRAIARKFRIKQCKTTAYHPQSNGSVERSHHVLWEYLKQYVDKEREWDELLKLATFSYNTSVHESTKYSPHELVFGKTARIPTSDPILSNDLCKTYTDYLTSLFDRLRDSQDAAKENLCQAKQRSKRYYDKKCNPQTFQRGNQVYLLAEPIKGKFADQYRGPYEILEVLKNNNVKLAVSKNRTRIVHCDKLKKLRYIGERGAHLLDDDAPTLDPAAATSTP